MSYSSLSQLVQAYESGNQTPGSGNYSAQSGSSTASGAYQFIDATWQRFLTAIGGSTAQYPTAASAPPAVQDQVFNQAVSQTGLSSWLCTGCNNALSNAVSANPSLLSLPTMSASGSGAPGSTSTVGSTTPTVPSNGSGGTPSEPTASGAAANDQGCGPWYYPTTWFCALGQAVASVASRGALLILAVVFIFGALLLFGLKSGIGIEESQGSN